MSHEEEVALREDRLRWMILRRDAVAAELARMEEAIDQESRLYANRLGVTCRPTRDQLRHQLLRGGKPE